MGRRYCRSRRNSNSAGALIRDVVELGNRLPWWGAAIMGLTMFSIFYWIVPNWVYAHWDSQPAYYETSRVMKTMVQQAFEPRRHWIRYIGIALGLIGVFFAVKNYFWPWQLSRNGAQNVGLFSRIIGRWLD